MWKIGEVNWLTIIEKNLLMDQFDGLEMWSEQFKVCRWQ
jgi:hypothetical protein